MLIKELRICKTTQYDVVLSFNMNDFLELCAKFEMNFSFSYYFHPIINANQN